MSLKRDAATDVRDEARRWLIENDAPEADIVRRLLAELAPDSSAASEVAYRYNHDSLVRPRNSGSEFEIDDLQPIFDFVNSKFVENGVILHVYSSIMEEFRKGQRCSVCGRTAKQNAAISYDCVNEC